MTGGDTPDKAFRAYSEPLQQALGCIASERLSVTRSARFEAGAVYTLVLNRNVPVTLKGAAPLKLSAGQRFRIIEDKSLTDGPYRIQVVDYWYMMSNVAGREILTFHWTPEADPDETRTAPHLHVGSVNISETAPLAPKTFNKLHIPTGDVSLQSVVRFLIEEAGVEPRRANWSEILDQGLSQVDS